MRPQRHKLSGLIVSGYSECEWIGTGPTKPKTPPPPNLKFETEERNIIDIMLFPKSYNPYQLIVLNTSLWCILRCDKALETSVSCSLLRTRHTLIFIQI
jgi:hypothetical protein